jgi:hypothetical protein
MMTTFSLVTTIMSLTIFMGFVAVSICRFGILDSYSAYAAKWTEAAPINSQTHLWSIVTVAAALFLAPAMIERGVGNPWQLLGFFAPLYLWLVAFTPDWETNKKQHIIHSTGAAICAIASILWACIICERFGTVLGCTLLMWVAGIISKTIERALVFWEEMGLFLSVYVILLIGG